MSGRSVRSHYPGSSQLNVPGNTYALVLLTFDFTSLVMLSFSVPSTAVSLVAIVLLSWLATGSMLLEMPSQNKNMSESQL